MSKKVIATGVIVTLVIIALLWYIFRKEQPECTQTEVQKEIVDKIDKTLKDMETCSCKDFCRHSD